jgi:hypothetical protein
LKNYVVLVFKLVRYCCIQHRSANLYENWLTYVYVFFSLYFSCFSVYFPKTGQFVRVFKFTVSIVQILFNHTSILLLILYFNIISCCFVVSWSLYLNSKYHIIHTINLVSFKQITYFLFDLDSVSKCTVFQVRSFLFLSVI